MSASVPAECGVLEDGEGLLVALAGRVQAHRVASGRQQDGRSPALPGPVCRRRQLRCGPRTAGGSIAGTGPLGSSRRSQWTRFTPGLLVPRSVRTTSPAAFTISTVGVSPAAAASQ